MNSIEDLRSKLILNKGRLMTIDKYKTPHTYITIVENIIDIQDRIMKLQTKIKGIK